MAESTVRHGSGKLADEETDTKAYDVLETYKRKRPLSTKNMSHYLTVP